MNKRLTGPINTDSPPHETGSGLRICTYCYIDQGQNVECAQIGQIHAIHEVLYQEFVVGREDFKDKLERKTSQQVRSGQPGRQ